MTQSRAPLPSRPLLYLETAGSGRKQTAAEVSYQDESREILPKHGLVINDETGLDSWGCGSQKHHCPHPSSEYFKGHVAIQRQAGGSLKNEMGFDLS